jgi:hypothetical protein
MTTAKNIQWKIGDYSTAADRLFADLAELVYVILLFRNNIRKSWQQ